MAPRKGKAPTIPKPQAPGTFVELPSGFSVVNMVPTEERVPEPLASSIADFAAWLKTTRSKKRQLKGEKDIKLRRKNLPPLEALLVKYPIEQPEEKKPVEEEKPEPRRRLPRETLQHQGNKGGRTTRAMMRASEIKEEFQSPPASPAKTPVEIETPVLRPSFSRDPSENQGGPSTSTSFMMNDCEMKEEMESPVTTPVSHRSALRELNQGGPSTGTSFLMRTPEIKAEIESPAATPVQQVEVSVEEQSPEAYPSSPMETSHQEEETYSETSFMMRTPEIKTEIESPVATPNYQFKTPLLKSAARLQQTIHGGTPKQQVATQSMMRTPEIKAEIESPLATPDMHVTFAMPDEEASEPRSSFPMETPLEQGVPSTDSYYKMRTPEIKKEVETPVDTPVQNDNLREAPQEQGGPSSSFKMGDAKVKEEIESPAVTPVQNGILTKTPKQQRGPAKAIHSVVRTPEIKAEIQSPAATPVKQVKPPVLKSVADRIKAEFAELPRKNGVASRVASPHRAAAPVAPQKKTNAVANKYNEALERKEQQAKMKAEKLRKENEEKKKKVEAKRLQQEEETKKKRADILKKEQAAQLRRQAHLSPARSRIASAMNTPTRKVFPTATTKTPSNLVRSRLLFADAPSRTPGRMPAKAAKLVHPAVGVTAAVSTNFGSAPREVKRKPARPLIATDRQIKKEQEEAPPVQQNHALEEDAAALRAKQMRLLMGDDDEEEKLLQERKRLAAEKEQKRIQKEKKLQRQKEEEERKREEKRKAMEEERRREEKKRQLEEAQKKAAEAAEELRLREEEMARLKREQEEREEEELAKKLNESMLEDQDEAMEEDEGQEQKHGVSSYDMTMDKIFLPSTAENYNIEDLDSGDETDDDTAPRKKVPTWAEWPALTRLGLDQAKMARNFDEMYGIMESPHTQPIFKPSKKPRRIRGSSAQWNSPASNPTKGKSRFLGM